MVASGLRNTRGSFGIRFIIQSNYRTSYILECLQSYLQDQRDVLKSMDGEEFENHKTSVILKKLEKIRTLKQESDKWWKAIVTRSYDFDAPKLEAETIKTIAKEEIISFFERHFLSKDVHSKIGALFLSQKPQLPNPEKPQLPNPEKPQEELTQDFSQHGELIESFQNFKSAMSLYPFFQPSQKFLKKR